MATASMVLLILFAVQAVLQYFDLRQSVEAEIQRLAAGVSIEASASLAGNDPAAAETALAGLKANPKISCGIVYDRHGERFAVFGDRANPDYLEYIRDEQVAGHHLHFSLDKIYLHRPIIRNGEQLGSLFLQARLVNLKSSVLRFTSIWGLSILVAWLVSLLLSRKFRDVVSEPIEKLAEGMKAVSEKRTYSLRIDDAGADELGKLADSFNQMLEQIELRDSELMLNRDRLDHMAHHDSLTGLPNRLLFNDRLKQAVQRAERSKRPLALIFIDLDRFKNINDTLGHDIGDLVLVETAHRLEQVLRRSDTIARLGGDEFVVILEEFESQQSVSQIARKIIHELSNECQILEHRLYVTASLGISFYPDNGTDLTTLKRCADIAMFRAKEFGRNNYQFYMPGMGDRVKKMLAMENDLRAALDRRELRLFFQPQVSMKNGSVSGAEALLRWQHPQLGLILPGEFIPLAEETDLIVEMGAWVIGETCRVARIWIDQGLGPLSFAVNVSPRQFRQDNMVDVVRKALEESALPPHLLELEVTETLLMTDIEDAIEKMTKLKELGVKLVIDDFGSGYSSLSYLKHFPISKLKIDRNFVKDLANDRNDLAIAASVASLARIMGLQSLAEGVENKEQERALLGLGMEWAQGFLYERPLAADQFEVFLHQAEIYISPAPGEFLSFETPPGLEKPQLPLGGESPLVMAVDPDGTFLAQLTIVLNRLGYDVLPVSDFDEALEQARIKQPRGVFLPDSPQGLALFTALRDDPALSELPVILAARDNCEAGRDICRKLGAAACLSLPIRGESLCETLALCKVSPGAARQNLRTFCEEQATLYHAGSFVTVRVLSLSEGGAYVAGDVLLAEGDAVQIQLTLEEQAEQQRLNGSVLYVKTEGGKFPPGAAIRFQDVPPQQAARLRRTVEDLLIGDLLREQEERFFSFSQ